MYQYARPPWYFEVWLSMVIMLTPTQAFVGALIQVRRADDKKFNNITAAIFEDNLSRVVTQISSEPNLAPEWT